MLKLGIFKQFQVSTGTKQSRRNIKRWKDNCSTDTVRKNKSSFEYVEGKEILAHSAIKADGQMWTNSKSYKI
jgi:hypothetical protein